MNECWPSRSTSFLRSALCSELRSWHGEAERHTVAVGKSACFDVETVVEVEGVKAGPTRSHVALRNLKIERSKSSRRTSCSSESSTGFGSSSEFELALVFEKPGRFTLPISDITRIRCKYVHQGKASIESRDSLFLLSAALHNELEKLLEVIKDVNAVKLIADSRLCVACKEKEELKKRKKKMKQKREQHQQPTDFDPTSWPDGGYQATKKQKIKVLDCIFGKKQLPSLVDANQEQVYHIKDLLKSREHGSQTMSKPTSDGSFNTCDSGLTESEDELYHNARSREVSPDDSTGCWFSPMQTKVAEAHVVKPSPPTRKAIFIDQIKRRNSLDVIRRRVEPDIVSEQRRGVERRNSLKGKESFDMRTDEDLRKIGDEAVERFAQRRGMTEVLRKVQEEQRRVEEEKKRRDERRKLEVDERREAEESEKLFTRNESLKKLLAQERKRKDDWESDLESKKEEAEKKLRDEEERLRRSLERRVQEEKLRKEKRREEEKRKEQERRKSFLDIRFQEEKKRRKHDEDRRVKELQYREDERKLQEQKRIEEERKLEELKQREEERRVQELKQREEERRVQELKQREAERRLQELKQREEECRLEEQKQREEERRLEEQEQREEERKSEEQKQREEERRLQEQKQREEERRLQELKQREEERRLQELKQREEERRLQELKEREEERKMQEQKQREEERKLQEQKQREEERKLQEQKKKVEERKLQEQKLREEECRRVREVERRLQEQERSEEDDNQFRDVLRKLQNQIQEQIEEKRKQEEDSMRETMNFFKQEEDSQRLREQEESRKFQESVRIASRLSHSLRRGRLSADAKLTPQEMRKILEEKLDKQDPRKLDEDMRRWQTEENGRRAKDDSWAMPENERSVPEEPRLRVEDVTKMPQRLHRRSVSVRVKADENAMKQAPGRTDGPKALDNASANDKDICQFQRSFLGDKAFLDQLFTPRENQNPSVGGERLRKSGEVFKQAFKPSETFVKPDRLRQDQWKKAEFDRKEELRKLELRKAELERKEELRRSELERKKAEKAADDEKKRLAQERKLEAKRLEKVLKEAQKRAKAEERQRQQQKQAEEQARQKLSTSAVGLPRVHHSTYRKYEESWNTIKTSGKKTPLLYSDIPWPPHSNPLFVEAGDSLDAQRRKLRIALLRWHPDKFLSLCGHRLSTLDRASIEARAKTIAQEVIQWKSKLDSMF